MIKLVVKEFVLQGKKSRFYQFLKAETKILLNFSIKNLEMKKPLWDEL